MLKTEGLGALLEVEMSKKRTPLWREAHLEVKSLAGFCKQKKRATKTRRRMARERRGAESSVVSMETLYYKTIY